MIVVWRISKVLQPVNSSTLPIFDVPKTPGLLTFCRNKLSKHLFIYFIYYIYLFIVFTILQFWMLRVWLQQWQQSQILSRN